MYEELVKRLHQRIALTTAGSPLQDDLRDAADAIEELEMCCDRIERDYKALCNYLPKWISVKDRLPEKKVWVLCACRANIFCVMRWDGIDWYENPTHIYMSGFVTHWMPLPEPPKEET